MDALKSFEGLQGQDPLCVLDLVQKVLDVLNFVLLFGLLAVFDEVVSHLDLIDSDILFQDLILFQK